MDVILPVEDSAQWLRSFGIWALAVSLLLNILISIAGVIPSIFLSAANAAVFGMIPGFFVSLAGETIGAGISFWLFRAGIQRIGDPSRWNWVHRLNETGRLRRAAALLAARLTPFIPSGLVTFAGAMSRIKFSDFMIVTIVGKAPSIALETMVGHDLLFIEENFPRLLITLLLVTVIFLLLKKKKRPNGSDP